jgi:hypothetical protein
VTGPQAPPGKRIGPAWEPDRIGASGSGKKLDTKVTPTRGQFLTPAMAALGIPAVDCMLDKAIGYPNASIQELISAEIVAAEARAAVSSSPGRKLAKAGVVCARPSCRNQFVPRRHDQHTCGTARCRQWWSRQQRTKNVTVARRRGGGGGDTGNREYGPVNAGPVEANCDSPRSVGGAR